MITFSVEKKKLEEMRADVAVLFCFSGEEQQVLKSIASTLDRKPAALRLRPVTGEQGDPIVLESPGIHCAYIVLLQLGKREDVSLEIMRRAAARGVKTAGALHARHVAFLLPDLPGIDEGDWEIQKHLLPAVGAALAEGVVLSSYRFDRFLHTSAPAGISRVTIVTTKEEREMREAIRRAQKACEGTLLARDLTNTPANLLSPAGLAAAAQKAGKQAGFHVNVLDEKRIAALGMGGLSAVAQGSARPPRFITLEYHRGAKARGTVVLVGKGVTFDAGGISIKPSAGMAEMKMDMAGAAAVIGLFYAAASLRLPLHLVGLIPATENLPGGSAMRPGDILTHYNGKTSEVDNTDAEGRLILADALSYAEKFSPDLVIDLATLTGAVVVALGHVASGMLGNDQQTMELLSTAGRRTYERVWQLPLYAEYDRLIKSDIADVKNVGGRWAGAITGAMFLKKFIGSHRWVHLDIAGTAMMEEATAYVSKGGSGVGVRLLLEFLRGWTKPRGKRQRSSGASPTGS